MSMALMLMSMADMVMKTSSITVVMGDELNSDKNDTGDIDNDGDYDTNDIDNNANVILMLMEDMAWIVSTQCQP